MIESGHPGNRNGDEIRSQNPLRIYKASYIITVCYPAKNAGCLRVYTAFSVIHQFELHLLPGKH